MWWNTWWCSDAPSIKASCFDPHRDVCVLVLHSLQCFVSTKGPTLQSKRERGSWWDAWQQYSSSTDWGSATSSHRFCWTSAEYIGCGCKESQSLGYKVGKSDAFWVHHPQPSDLPTWPWTPQLVLGGPVYTSGMVNPARPTGQANSNKSCLTLVILPNKANVIHLIQRDCTETDYSRHNLSAAMPPQEKSRQWCPFPTSLGT